jgi:hypothetical protein
MRASMGAGDTMETKTVRFIPHGLDSPEVQARLTRGEGPLQERLDRINARFVPHMARFQSRFQALVNSKRNADYCIPEFWRVVDDAMALVDNDKACRRGCSHCCYTMVLLTQDEADVIGKRIGRKVKQVKPPGRGRADKDAFDFGYHNPCPFLDDGECSIYENRPLPCRTQINVDTDALMCELTPPESKPVPYLNPHPYLMAFLQMLGVPQVEPVLGDIREFFPKVTK